MAAQRRTALISVLTACALIALKLVAGIASGSLGLVSEAAHSGTDLIAALLTFFALGVAVRPADLTHPYGHGKAEHLSALAEAAILVAVSAFIISMAVDRLVGGSSSGVDAAWWTFAVIGGVIALDASRATVSLRAARRFRSPALRASALHFASDLAGSLAVLAGLGFVRAGFAGADSVAALFVAGLVLIAAARLMRSNIDVLMDRTPAAAQAAALRAIQRVAPTVDLRRLRLREAAGRYFADVVIGVSGTAAVAEAHAVADAVEEAVERALPGADVVVHVEPAAWSGAGLRERALEAALRIPGVQEIHNVTVVRVGDRIEVSLHLKLPGDMSLDEAHVLASRVEATIAAALPEVDAVQTHLEPLAETASAVALDWAEVQSEAEAVRRIVEASGARTFDLRFLRTDSGLVAFLTLEVDAESLLAHAHAQASAIEEKIRTARPDIADVIVHTEPRSRSGARATSRG